MKRALFFAGFAGCLFLTSTASAGEGLARGIERMPKAERQTTMTAIAQARHVDTGLFDEVASVRAAMPRLEKTKRGRLALVSPALVALGKRSTAPLLERLVVLDDTHADLSPVAFNAWRIGVIEALGKLREGKAVPGLTAILRGGDTDPDLTRATTLALARIGTKEAVEALLATDGQMRTDALFALGDCRKEISVLTLIGELRAASSLEMQQVLIDALGRVGSSWAWATPTLAADPSRDRIRSLAATALVEAAVRIRPEARNDLALALAMVEHDETPRLLADAKRGAIGENLSTLVAIEKSFLGRPSAVVSK